MTLQALTLRGVPPRARDVLRLRGANVQADGTPAVEATLATPKGDVVLQSPE